MAATKPTFILSRARSALKPGFMLTGLVGLTAGALLTLTSFDAQAATAITCANLSSSSSGSGGGGGTPPYLSDGSGYAFQVYNSVSLSAGDQVSVTVKNGVSRDVLARMIWGRNSTPFLADSGEQTLQGEETKVLSFTASADGQGDLYIVASPSAGFPSVSCTSASSGSDSNSGGNETTSKAVTSAVARSQTTVIQQNIGARAATVIGSAGAGTVGTGGSTGNAGAAGGLGGSGTGGAPTGNDDGNSFTQAGFADTFQTYANRQDDTRNVMRRLAMTSSFDSSILAADMARESALALGPTDQGSSGGASGVDGRTALLDANASPITVWGHGSYTSVDNDYNDGTSDNRYDGDVWGYNLGADYRFANNVIAGLSLGYNDTDLTTTFNNGTYKETTWAVSPYAIISPLENLNIVTEAGYSQGDIDVTRSNDAVSGKTDSALWYASLTTSYYYRPMDDLPLSLSPSVAFLAARKTIDSYTESDGTFVDSSRSNTRQIKPGIEAAYDFGFNALTVTPFVETGLVYDFTDELNNDKTAFNIGGGVRMSDSATGFNAALEGSYLAGRSDYTEYTVAGTVSYGFELRDLTGQPVGFVTPVLWQRC